MAGPEGLRKGCAREREGERATPHSPLGATQLLPSLPPPAPTFLALAGFPHKLHHELGEGKGLLGCMRGAEAPPSCLIV